jgi:hypothetical protein
MPKCLDNDGKYVLDNDPSDKPYCVKKKPSVLYVTLTFSEDGFRRLAKKAISVGEKVTICCFCGPCGGSKNMEMKKQVKM